MIPFSETVFLWVIIIIGKSKTKHKQVCMRIFHKLELSSFNMYVQTKYTYLNLTVQEKIATFMKKIRQIFSYPRSWPDFLDNRLGGGSLVDKVGGDGDGKLTTELFASKRKLIEKVHTASGVNFPQNTNVVVKTRGQWVCKEMDARKIWKIVGKCKNGKHGDTPLKRMLKTHNTEST